MHPKAKAYDDERGYNVGFGSNKPYKPYPEIPEGRPCDYCGEIVEKGYIHSKCQEAEAELWHSFL